MKGANPPLEGSCNPCQQYFPVTCRYLGYVLVKHVKEFFGAQGKQQVHQTTRRRDILRLASFEFSASDLPFQA